jgi:hypothetical protein
MNRCAGVLSAILLFVGPTMTVADESFNLSDLVQSDVRACTEKALAGDIELGEMFNWPFECARRGYANCTAAALDDKDRDGYLDIDRVCYDLGRAAWKDSADGLLQQLVDRWQKCDLPQQVKSSTVSKLARLDAAAYELNAAHCDYDSGQWNAVGKPGIAAQRMPRCLAEGEYTRAAVFYQLLLKDVGCEGAGE